MIVLEGLPALSPFRRERLELRLQSVAPEVRIAGAWHVYWIEPEPGSAPDPAVLRRVLEAGEERAPVQAGALTRFVSPRLGTISPWRARPPTSCAAPTSRCGGWSAAPGSTCSDGRTAATPR